MAIVPPPNFKFCIVSVENPEPGPQPLWATHNGHGGEFTVGPEGPNQEWKSNMGEKGFRMFIPGSDVALSVKSSDSLTTASVFGHESPSEGSVEEIAPFVYLLRMATGSPPGVECFLGTEGSKIVVKKFKRGSGGDRPAWKVFPLK